jgi:hypothetical protein
VNGPVFEIADFGVYSFRYLGKILLTQLRPLIFRCPHCRFILQVFLLTFGDPGRQLSVLQGIRDRRPEFLTFFLSLSCVNQQSGPKPLLRQRETDPASYTGS